MRNYNGAWKRKSKRFRNKHNICAICGNYVEQVHHIDPNGTDDEENLIALCTPCHKIVHDLYKSEENEEKKLLMI